MSSPHPALSVSELNAMLLVLTNEERILEAALRDIDAALASPGRQLPEATYYELKTGLLARLTDIRAELAYYRALRTTQTPL